MLKTLLISATFLGASVIGAAAQSSPTPPAAGASPSTISAATHCKDKVTGQPKLKSAAATPGSPSTTGSPAPSGSPPPSGSMSGSTSGSAGSPPSSTATAANLPDCP